MRDENILERFINNEWFETIIYKSFGSLEKIMKYLLIGMFMLGNFSAFAFEKVGTIRENGSDRKIELYKENNNLKFTLSDNSQSTILNVLSIKLESDTREITVETDKNNFYTFNIMKKMNEASGATTEFCWEGDEPAAEMGSILAPVTTIPLCVVSHTAPYILGAILFPVDSALTVADRFFDPEVVAARKFKKLLNGKDMEASSNVFKSLIRQVKSL